MINKKIDFKKLNQEIYKFYSLFFYLKITFEITFANNR